MEYFGIVCYNYQDNLLFRRRKQKLSLKSSNQVATNRYQLEIELPGDVFEKAVEQVYRKEIKDHDSRLP